MANPSENPGSLIFPITLSPNVDRRGLYQTTATFTETIGNIKNKFSGMFDFIGRHFGEATQKNISTGLKATGNLYKNVLTAPIKAAATASKGIYQSAFIEPIGKGLNDLIRNSIGGLRLGGKFEELTDEIKHVVAANSKEMDYLREQIAQLGKTTTEVTTDLRENMDAYAENTESNIKLVTQVIDDNKEHMEDLTSATADYGEQVNTSTDSIIETMEQLDDHLEKSTQVFKDTVNIISDIGMIAQNILKPVFGWFKESISFMTDGRNAEQMKTLYWTLAKQFGYAKDDFVESAKEIQSEAELLQTNFNLIRDAVIHTFQPAIASSMAFLNDFIMDNHHTIVESLKRLGEVIKFFATIFYKTFVMPIVKGVQLIYYIWKSMPTIIKDIIKIGAVAIVAGYSGAKLANILYQVGKAAKGLHMIFATLARNPFFLALASIIAAVTTLYLLWDDYTVWKRGGLSYFGDSWEKIEKPLQKVKDIFSEFVVKVKEFIGIIKGPFDSAMEGTGTKVEKLSKGVRASIQAISEKITGKKSATDVASADVTSADVAGEEIKTPPEPTLMQQLGSGIRNFMGIGPENAGKDLTQTPYWQRYAVRAWGNNPLSKYNPNRFQFGSVNARDMTRYEQYSESSRNIRSGQATDFDKVYDLLYNTYGKVSSQDKQPELLDTSIKLYKDTIGKPNPFFNLLDKLHHGATSSGIAESAEMSPQLQQPVKVQVDNTNSGTTNSKSQATAQGTLTPMIDKAVGFSKELWSFLKGLPIVGGLFKTIGSIFSTLGKNLPQVGKALGLFTTFYLQKFLFFINMLTKSLAFLGNLGTGNITGAINVLNSFVDDLNTIAKDIIHAVAGFFGWDEAELVKMENLMDDIFNTIKDLVRNVLPPLLELVKDLVNLDLLAVFGDIIEIFAGLAESIATAVFSALQVLAGKIGDLFAKLWNTIRSYIPEIVGGLSEEEANERNAEIDEYRDQLAFVKKEIEENRKKREKETIAAGKSYDPALDHQYQVDLANADLEAQRRVYKKMGAADIQTNAYGGKVDLSQSMIGRETVGQAYAIERNNIQYVGGVRNNLHVTVNSPAEANNIITNWKLENTDSSWKMMNGVPADTVMTVYP